MAENKSTPQSLENRRRDWAALEQPCYPLAEIVHYWCELPADKKLKVDGYRLPIADPDYPMVAVRTALLRDAVATHQLPHEATESRKDHYRCGEGIRWCDKVVRRATLIQWFEQYRSHERPPFLFWQDELEEIQSLPSAPAYLTPLLEIQYAAIREFFDPRRDIDPKKPEVVEWITERIEEAGLPASNNVAEAIFTIIKPADHSPRKRRVDP